MQFLPQDISLFPMGLVSHARKQNAFYRDAQTSLQKVRVRSMESSMPMHRCTLDTTLLWPCLLLSRKPFVDLALKPKKSDRRDAGNGIAVSRKGATSFGALSSAPPACCCEGEQDSCTCLLHHLHMVKSMQSSLPCPSVK